MLMYVCMSDSGVQKELYRSGLSSYRTRATAPITPKPSALSSTRGNTLPLSRQRMSNMERLLYLCAAARAHVDVGAAHQPAASQTLETHAMPARLEPAPGASFPRGIPCEPSVWVPAGWFAATDLRTFHPRAGVLLPIVRYASTSCVSVWVCVPAVSMRLQQCPDCAGVTQPYWYPVQAGLVMSLGNSGFLLSRSSD